MPAPASPDRRHATPPPTETAGGRRDETRWLFLMRSAETAMAQHDVAGAASDYRRALRLAEALLTRAECADGPLHAPAMLLATRHGLAADALATGQHVEARTHFCAAADRLLQTARTASAPPALREASVALLKTAVAALPTHGWCGGARRRASSRALRITTP
jgi:hypothetical protein